MAEAKQVVKGTKTYRLTEPHYRLGRVYQAGELITVTDEVPGRTWVPLEAEKAAAATAPAPQPAKRPSDKDL